VLERLNGEDGSCHLSRHGQRARSAGGPRLPQHRASRQRALEKLWGQRSSAYCQPGVTGWIAPRPRAETGGAAALAASARALDWLQPRSPDDPELACAPTTSAGGVGFQFSNSHYPLDDTAVVAWSMHQRAIRTVLA